MNKAPSDNPKIRLLVLGDSYTIGEGVLEEERWPSIAARGAHLPDQIEVIYVAKTGWTTDELLAAIKKQLPEGKYDFVSLLIGVNNQYRGYPIDVYEREFEELLKRAIEFSGNNHQNVVVLSIPDYGVTPFSDRLKLDSVTISNEIDQYNLVAKKQCKNHKIQFFDITGITREVVDDPSYMAEDRLHPSGRMYQKWAAIVIPWLEERFK